MLWWLISLGIAAAIIYYVFSARGVVRNVEEPERPDKAGLDEEMGLELEPELGLGETDDELAAGAVPALDDENTAVTTLTNLNEAGAIARGSRGEGGHDEEYAEGLPMDEEPVRHRDVPEDEDEYDGFEDDEHLDAHFDRDTVIEGETYMDATKVQRETRSDKKRRKRQKR